MEREDLEKQLLECTENNILLELTTGYGKTKLAIEKINTLYNKNSKILIFIPRLVLIETWKKEFKKWKKEKLLNNVTFSTYASIDKHKGDWDIIVYDEAHHLSPRCRKSLKEFNSKYNILLSATIKKELKDSLSFTFKNLLSFKVTIKQAINAEVLPDPEVYLLPLNLPNGVEQIIKNPKGKHIINCEYKDRWKYVNNKNCKIVITCTTEEYLADLNSQIEWYKNKYFITNNIIFKTKWLKLCGDRLKWLSNKKKDIILSLLNHFKNERVITFCNSIEQTKELGSYAINSKNKEAEYHLKLFNSNKIKHITACNMLNEGVNLNNCKIGLYASLNSSEILIKQKLGRLLRHPEPLIVIPYYKGTREEELVQKMIEDYNSNLIKIIHYENNNR